MVTRRSVLRAAVVVPVAAAATAMAGCSDTADPRASSHTRLTPSVGLTSGPGVTTSVSSAGVRIEYLPGVSDAMRGQTPALVDAALARVRSVWASSLAAAGRSLAAPRRVQVAATSTQFLALGGGGAQGVAATTQADGTVVVSPQVWSGTSRDGRIVVFAHEFTHVVLHSQVSSSARWLVEGAPEWTAYHGTSLSLPVIAPQQAAAVRTGDPAAGPPADGAFTRGPIQAAYQSAFTWCTFLVQRSTAEVFTRFVLAATDRSAGQLPDIFEAHYGASMASLASAYQQFQRTTFGTVRPSA